MGNPHAGLVTFLRRNAKVMFGFGCTQTSNPQNHHVCNQDCSLMIFPNYNYFQVSNVSILGFVKKACFWMLQQLALHQVLILFAVVLCGEIWGVAGTLTMRKSLPGGRWFQNVKWDGYNYTSGLEHTYVATNMGYYITNSYDKLWAVGKSPVMLCFFWEGNHPQEWILFLFISGFMNKRLKPQRPSNQQTMKSQSKESHTWLSHNLMMNNTKDINQNAP